MSGAAVGLGLALAVVALARPKKGRPSNVRQVPFYAVAGPGIAGSGALRQAVRGGIATAVRPGRTASGNIDNRDGSVTVTTEFLEFLLRKYPGRYTVEKRDSAGRPSVIRWGIKMIFRVGDVLPTGGILKLIGDVSKDVLDGALEELGLGDPDWGDVARDHLTGATGGTATGAGGTDTAGGRNPTDDTF